ncbi:MAG: VanZ family protein [Verrucomicrobia bacterium]|nr:VanZ family protein [Verrucomicrobiota bacterium]
MSHRQTFLKYWLPVIVWMSLIFTASGDRASLQRSSRIIEPVLRWLFPHLADDTVQLIVFLVRKCAHLTEFAVLAWLFWRAVRKPMRNDPRPWQWREAFIALACVALCAASDEIHQLFVPSRQGSVLDVLIDTSGAAFGLLAVWAVGRWQKLR